MIKRLHLITGLLFIGVFALTGQYMIHVAGVPEMQDQTARVLYRASHMYILFIAIINVIAGIMRSPLPSQGIEKISQASSIILLIAQPLFLYAFFTEPSAANLERPVTFFSFVALLVATGGLLLSHWLANRSRSLSQSDE